ncbi:hypothetical protein HS125_15715 [bacterium]|nr:hypothetical protein [bacterium]
MTATPCTGLNPLCLERLRVVAQSLSMSKGAPGSGLPVWKRFQWEDGKLLLLEGLRYSKVAEMARPVVIDYVMQVATWARTRVVS